MKSGGRSVCFRGDFTTKTLVVFMRKNSLVITVYAGWYKTKFGSQNYGYQLW